MLGHCFSDLLVQHEFPGELEIQVCLGASPRDPDPFVLGCRLDIGAFNSFLCDSPEQLREGHRLGSTTIEATYLLSRGFEVGDL